MPQSRVVSIPGYGKVTFPDSMSDDDVNKAAAGLYKDQSLKTQLKQPDASRPSHGASGSFEKDYSQTPILGPLARFGREADETAVDTIQSGRAAFTEPPHGRAEEVASVGMAGSLGLPAYRLTVEPQLEQFRQARKAPTTAEKVGHYTAAAIPFLGPMAARIGETLGNKGIPEALGQSAAFYLLPKTVEEAATPLFKPRSMPPIKADEMNDLGFVIKPGVKNAPLQPTAMAVQPLLKQSAQEAGFSQALNLTAQRFGHTPTPGDAFGDLYRGGTEAQARIIAKKLGQEYNPADPTPIPLMIADHAVDIAQRPMDSFINHFADENATTEAQAIAADLDKRAADTLDDSLASNYRKLAAKARAAKTVSDVNQLKVYANKESARLHKLYPGQQIQASVTPIQAFKDLADSTRQHLYPKLQSMGAPNLFEFGRQEAAAIAARDGIYQSWTEAAIKQAMEDRQSYLDWVTEGHSDTFRFALSERSASTVSMVGRALKGRPSALREFNSAFKSGIGSFGGFKPADILLTKNPRLIGPNRPSSDLGSTMQVTGAKFGERRPANIPPSQLQGNQSFIQAGEAAKPKGQLELGFRAPRPDRPSGKGPTESSTFFEEPKNPRMFWDRMSQWQPAQAKKFSTSDLHSMLSDVENFLKRNPQTADRQRLTKMKIEMLKEIDSRSQSESLPPGRSKWRQDIIDRSQQ